MTSSKPPTDMDRYDEDPTKAPYITFKTDEFFQMMGGFLPKDDTDCAPIVEQMVNAAREACISDAVVIRLQDRFSGPAFHTYAANIGLVSTLLADSDQVTSARLAKIADYFSDMAAKADELNLNDAAKLPD